MMKHHVTAFRICSRKTWKGAFSFLVLLYVSATALTLQAQTLTNYSNNFDSLTAGTSIGTTAVNQLTGNDNGSTTQISVSSATSYSGSNSLFLLDNNTLATTTATLGFGFASSFTGVTNDTVSFALKSNANTTMSVGVMGANPTINFTLVHENNSGISEWELRAGSSTILAYATDTSTGYTPSNWNLVSFTFNEATDSFSLSLNGTAVLTVANGALTLGTSAGSSTTYSSVAWNMNQLNFNTGYYSGGATTYYNYLDDLSVVAVPEPSTLALTALSLFCAGGLALAHRRKGLCATSSQAA